MRILHVSDCYLPRTGGIELHVRDLAGYQRRAGAEVTVATVTADPRDTSGQVVRLPALGTFPHPRALAELTRMITAGGYDVVHAHSSLVSPLAGSAAGAAAAAGIPAVMTMHSMLPTGVVARALRTLAPRPATDITWTAVSTAAAASLRGVLRGEDVSVLPNGIDPRDWARDNPPSASGPLTLVSVMRTARRKRPLQLLDILRTIRQQVPASQRLRAILVGSGPLDRAIRRELSATGLDRWVTHAGQLDRPGIRAVLHRSDLYLAPAVLESFGIAAQEARCAGLPVIGMARGGIGDFISEGTEGFLVDSDAAMAAQAARLLSDPARLHQIQQHNRLNLPAISWPRVLEQHWLAYAAAGAAAGELPRSGTMPWRAGSMSRLSGS
jgi:glycosyltransferase involved in cell wall biosynthesis